MIVAAVFHIRNSVLRRPDQSSPCQVGNHVRIDLSAHDGDTIILHNFALADLDAGDFLL